MLSTGIVSTAPRAPSVTHTSPAFATLHDLRRGIDASASSLLFSFVHVLLPECYGRRRRMPQRVPPRYYSRTEPAITHPNRRSVILSPRRAEQSQEPGRRIDPPITSRRDRSFPPPREAPAAPAATIGQAQRFACRERGRRRCADGHSRRIFCGQEPPGCNSASKR